ncbi:helix-turn-helix domain-containing protein [Planctomicrobium sp. SH664]|uniref:helix-turn-helix domain-containing protein n=1 Tax=Planctomicrobium sp. SH664 TaxID=3448125 RepID=UPI003F5B394C
MKNDFLDTRDAARMLNHSPITLACWRQRGVGPSYVKMRGKVLYQRKDLQRYIDDHRISSREVEDV